MSLLPHYIHVLKPSLKHIYLSLNDEGTLVIKAGKISLNEIERILIKRASWIQKAYEQFYTRKGKAVTFNTSSELYFLGKPYPLKLMKHEKKQTTLNFENNLFILYYSTYDTKIFQKKINQFYKKAIEEYLPPYIKQWENKMQLYSLSIKFRKTKRQWGSCSSRNNLSFNTMLMKLPNEIIQYIIVHEISHIKYKHHQKEFWDFVSKYQPEYKTIHQRLKEFTT